MCLQERAKEDLFSISNTQLIHTDSCLWVKRQSLIEKKTTPLTNSRESLSSVYSVTCVLRIPEICSIILFMRAKKTQSVFTLHSVSSDLIVVSSWIWQWQ